MLRKLLFLPAGIGDEGALFASNLTTTFSQRFAIRGGLFFTELAIAISIGFRKPF